MDRLVYVAVALMLLVSSDGFNAHKRVKRQHEIDVLYEDVCVDENGDRDFYCMVFCPFLHDLFLYSLRQPVACAFGMKSSIDCSKETNVCNDWCTHVYNQLNMFYLHQRPKEWDICADGERPPGCDKDRNCIRWCDMVYGSYQNASSALVGCMKTGQPPPDCNDEQFCQDVCDTSEKQSHYASEIVFKCGIKGTAPWP